MRLKNKKTGEIKECVVIPVDSNGYPNEYQVFEKGESLAELNEEWCDYEEPEEFYIVEHRGTVGSRFRTGAEYEEKFKEIGNYFETKEEAEKAVGKLKAWKRVKRDLVSLNWQRERDGSFSVWGEFKTGNTLRADVYLDIHSKDLDQLFGGEE